MASSFRLPEGGRIDRSKRLTFRFDGQPYQGFAGDTLASALIANGVHLVGRSFKYHRPRGFLAAGSEEPGALVQVGAGARTEPNVCATQVELHDGLEAASVNAWPSLGFDVNAIRGWFGKLLPAGFYYKTFMPSQWLWMKVIEPYIREGAGWGRAPTEPDPDYYDHKHVHCDVLVVGGGPAGLAAGVAAGLTGARVIIADEHSEFGGSLLSLRREIDGKPGAGWVAEQVAALNTMENARLLARTTVFGYYDHNYLCALESRTDHTGEGSSPAKPRTRLWHMRAKHVILASGAHERPLVFADNDRPGTMLASAAQTYVNRYAAVPGRKALIFTNNDSAYEAAVDLHDAGLRIAAVVDTRADPKTETAEQLRRKGIDLLAGQAVTGVKGAKRVQAVQIRPLSKDKRSVLEPERTISCDVVLMSGGWSPVVHLFCQSRGKLVFNDSTACLVPGQSMQEVAAVGACNGTFDLAGCLREGATAGAFAAQAAGFGGSAPTTQEFRVAAPEAFTIEPLWLVPSKQKPGHGKAKHFVDFQNDTTAADIQLAAREGYESVELMKRYTLTGFGTDQGKTGNVNGLAILSEYLGRSIPETGTTTFRPPYTPLPFGAMAGRELGLVSAPVRVTAIHDWHVANGAKFEDVGQWKRPWFFAKPGEDMHAAVNRECLAVRNGVGVLDASTLGKIDVQGPDAAEFLNRIYTNAWSKLEVGRARYGVMCHEDGMIFDDGTTSRLAENRFLMTTTTGGAANVLDWLEEYLQTEWPDLKVYCTSVTEQWATVSVAGPKSRAVLEKICSGVDLGPDTFPFMRFRDGTAAGIPARIFRISFTGELSYEINVPWWHGRALWEAVMEAGREFGMTPYGTETMHVLRAEKGFIIAGQDTDGTVTPQDLGMDWLVSKKKKDFLGKRSFAREDTRRPDRKQLVGLFPEDPNEVLPEGAQLVDDPKLPVPTPMTGHVTSSYYSACLGRSFALALVRRGRERLGERVFAPLESKTVAAQIVEPVFYDPEGTRKDG